MKEWKVRREEQSTMNSERGIRKETGVGRPVEDKWGEMRRVWDKLRYPSW